MKPSYVARAALMSFAEAISNPSKSWSAAMTFRHARLSCSIARCAPAQAPTAVGGLNPVFTQFDYDHPIKACGGIIPWGDFDADRLRKPDRMANV
jgi:hypothetical protein